MSRHFIISDCQVKPHTDKSYLRDIGKYIVEKKPDVVIQIGDFADMESLSSYDVGKKSFEGRRYNKDVEACHEALDILTDPLREYNNQQRKNGKKQYKPRMVLTLGNHENRINRAVDGDPKLDGTLSIDDLCYGHYGFEVIPFLEVILIDGIAYSHYFVSGLMGRPVTSAASLLTKKHMSCVMGHVQNRQIAYSTRADGKQITAIFSGSTYTHDEDYLGHQGNDYWRGIWILNEVSDGSFDEMPVSLSYLKSKYN